MKKILCLLVLMILFASCPIYANDVETYERIQEENYGVKKHWTINEENINNVLRTPLVDSSKKIYDFANILTKYEEDELYKEIKKFNDKTNMDMIILTVDFDYFYDSENEDYAADFYDYNDFGIDFENNSGVLLLRNINETDPYFNIYTFGNCQLYFTYERLEDTLDNIYYDLKNKNYPDGFNEFISEMTNYYNKGIPNKFKYSYVNEDGYLIYVKKYQPPIIIALIISSIITLIVITVLKSKNKMIKIATNASDYLDRKSINYIERYENRISSHTTSHLIETSSSSSSGGGSHFSSSSGSSGGGHSSGGGRHG